MIGASRQAGSHLLDCCLLTGTPHLPLHQLGFAFGDGAGLVQRHRLQKPGIFQIGSALDQDPTARSRGQSADHGDRRGNDQSAWAGDHQKNQGLVKRLQPGKSHQERSEDRHRHGNGEDCGGVDGGEPIHKALRRSARALRLLNGLDDPGQGGVARQGCDLELQLTSLVDRASEHLVAWCFVHGDALASHGGLVDGAITLGHLTVQRHAFARFDAHGRSNGHRSHRCSGPRSVGAQYQSLFGRQFQQALDSVSGPVHCLGFDELRNRVQSHHHRGFWPLTNEECAGDGHRHQRIDVQLAAQQRRNAFFVGVDAGQPDSQSGNRHAGHFPGHLVGREERKYLSPCGEHQRGHQTGDAACKTMPMVVAFGGSSRVSALSFAGACNWLRIEARIADGVECQRVGAFLCVDLQRPRAQLKTQRADPIQRLQRLTNLRLLGATVHRRNAKHPALATLGVCRSGHGLWIETRLADGIERKGQGAILRIDLQRARAELETQRADSLKRFQSPPDLRLFGTAVHGGDSEQLALARAACGCRDHCCGTGTARGAAGVNSGGRSAGF